MAKPKNSRRNQPSRDPHSVGSIGQYLRGELGEQAYQKLLDRSYGLARRTQRKQKRAD